VVEHATFDDESITLDAVKSSPPKLRPVTVMVPPLEDGRFGICEFVRTGESNESRRLRVPATEETVRTREPLMPPPTSIKHSTVVEVDHAVVRQSDRRECVGPDTLTEAVGLNEAKFRP